jgi:hypothetical protein
MVKYRLQPNASVLATRYINRETGNSYIFEKNIDTEVAKEDVSYFDNRTGLVKSKDAIKKTPVKPKVKLSKLGNTAKALLSKKEE